MTKCLVGWQGDFVVFKHRSIRYELLRLVDIEINVFGLESYINTFSSEVSVSNFVFFYEFNDVNLVFCCLNNFVGFVARKIPGENVVPRDFDFTQVLLSGDDRVFFQQEFFSVFHFL